MTDIFAFKKGVSIKSDHNIDSGMRLKLAGTGIMALLSLSAPSLSQAQFGDGFKRFPQDSCDPLLTGVLTKSGYRTTSLNELYSQAYGKDIRTSCNFIKVSEVSTQPGAPVNQTVPALPAPIPAVPGLNPLVIPTIIDETPNTTGDIFDDNGSDDFTEVDDFSVTQSRSGPYFRLSGAYSFTSEAPSSFKATDAADDVEPTTFTDKIKSGYGGSLAAGYSFDFGSSIISGLRAELQGSYYTFSGDAFTDEELLQLTAFDDNGNNNETILAGFANVIVDLGLPSLPLKPYIGGGVGYAQREITFGSESFKNQGLVYQAMIGLGYEVTEDITFELGYKYLRSFDLESVVGTTGSWSVEKRNHHMVEAGLKYSF